MGQVTGVIQEIANKGRGKGSFLTVDGKKYGVFEPNEHNFDQLSIGDEVTFDVSVNGQYTNIVKNTLSKTGNTGPVVPKSTGSGGASGGGGRGRYHGSWPIAALDGQRSIIRQNSLTHATNMVNTYCIGCNNDMSLEDRYQQIIDFAKLFEEFSAGDDIARAADEALKAMGSTAD